MKAPKTVQTSGAEARRKVQEMAENRSEQNLFSNYTRTRKSRKELDATMEDNVHPDLLANPNVTLEKFENNTFRRGLQEGETPFPIIAKVGPYIVSNFHMLTLI